MVRVRVSVRVSITCLGVARVSTPTLRFSNMPKVAINSQSKNTNVCCCSSRTAACRPDNVVTSVYFTCAWQRGVKLGVWLQKRLGRRMRVSVQDSRVG